MIDPELMIDRLLAAGPAAFGDVDAAYDAIEREAIEGEPPSDDDVCVGEDGTIVPVTPSAVVPRPRYRVLGPDEIFAPLPEAQYTVGGLLRRANLALVVAFGSSLKTWAAVDLLIAVATGGKFLERFDCPAPCPALAVDWESGEEELRRRIQGDARARGLSFPVAGVHIVTMPDVFFTSPDFEAWLDEIAARFKFIVFDSLAAGSLDIDENDARFAKGLQICRRVGERQQATIVVLHHSRKDGGEDSDERQSVRGTGAIFAAADVVLSLRRPKGGDEDAFVVRQTKARGGKRIEPFILRVDDVGPDAVRVYATDLAEVETVAAINENTSNMSKAKAGILSLLSADKTLRSANDVERRLRGTGCGCRASILAALRELQEHDLVTTHDHCLRLTKEVRP